MPVTSMQSEQKQTMQRLHISTYAVHQFDLFMSNSCFHGTSERYSLSPRHRKTPSDALTAETPRLGEDLRGSPHLPYSPVRALYPVSFDTYAPVANKIICLCLSYIHSRATRTGGSSARMLLSWSDLPSCFHRRHHAKPLTKNLSSRESIAPSTQPRISI